MNYIIYASGFIIAYILCKVLRGKIHNDWRDVWATIIISVFSWIGIFLLGIISIRYNYIKYKLTKKPPKWL